MTTENLIKRINQWLDGDVSDTSAGLLREAVAALASAQAQQALTDLECPPDPEWVDRQMQSEHAGLVPNGSGLVPKGGKLVPAPAASQDDTVAMHETFDLGFCPYKGSPDPWIVWQAAWKACRATPPAPEAEKREPLTNSQVRRLWNNSPEIHKDAPSFAAFKRIVDLVQSAHGIPPADAKDL